MERADTETRPRATQRTSSARILLTAAALALALSTGPAAAHQPFFPIETAPAAVHKRQACISDTYSCASLGSAFANICCASGQACTTDTSGSPACCPSGAVCTGTAPATFATPATGTPTAAVSYVPNSYFSFPYVATSFANSGACSSAVSQCSANYAACTAELEGTTAAGAYGVTIVVPGATTIVGGTATSLGTGSATSICSSLSSAACHDLQHSQCTMTGTTQSGFYIGTATGNFAARPPAACIGVAGVVAAGVAGFGAL